MRRKTLSKSWAPSYAVKVPVRAPRCSSQPPVTRAAARVPTTITVRARADAPGIFIFIAFLTLECAKRLREGNHESGYHSLMNRFLVSSPIYQLDWSALRMGVLPSRIGELLKRLTDALVEIVVGALHPVALPAGVGACQP